MRVLYVILICFATLVGCKRIDLVEKYYKSTDVRFSFDWTVFDTRADNDDDALFAASVWCFNRESGEVVPKASNDVSGITVSLTGGTYDAVGFNKADGYFSTVALRGGDNYKTFEVCGVEETTRGAWFTSRSSESITISQPEYFAADTFEELLVEDGSSVIYSSSVIEDLSSTSTSEISLTPEMLVYDMTLRVKIYGIQNLRDIEAALTGVAEGRVISDPYPNSTKATHILVDWTQEGSYGEGEIEMPFTSFGLASDPDTDVIDYEDWTGDVELIVQLIDNSTMTFNLPMDSNCIIEADGSLSLTLEIGMSADPDSQIVLPDVEPSDPEDSGGFDADVEDWGPEIGVEIPL